MAKITYDWLNNKFRALPLPGFSKPSPPTLPQPFDGNYDPVIEYLSALIKREMKTEQLTGLSIALVDNQKMIWSEGFGFANKALNIRCCSKTRYRAGSISKLFNAVAVMREVERGNLDLDTAVVEYVPGFQINSRFGPTDNITLRNLLTHHSGLPRDYLDGMWSHKQPPLDSILELLRSVHTAYPANKICAYSNIGVSLSGLAVQTRSGINYEDYMREYLLEPLQMSDSDFSGHLVSSDAALGYSKGEVVEEFPVRDLPAGGLNSTVDDMANFAIAMISKGRFGDKKILSGDSISEMLRVQNSEIPLDLTSRTGLAWAYKFDRLGGMFDVVFHTGGTVAHSTTLSLVPELGFGVIILCNTGQSNSVQRIANAALKQLLLTRNTQDNRQRNIAAHQDIIANEILPGDYAGSDGLIRVSRKKNKLYAKSLHTKKSYVLTKTNANWYQPEYKLRFIPVSVGDDNVRVTRSTIDGRDLLIIADDGNLDIVGKRIEPQSESDIWNKRLGYYRNRNPDGPVKFMLDGVSLQFGDGYYQIELNHRTLGKHKRAVKPISDTELVELGIGEGLGNTITYFESSSKPTLCAIGIKCELDASSSNHPSPIH